MSRYLFSNKEVLEALIDRYRYSVLEGLVKGIAHNLNGSLQILSMRMEFLQRMLTQEQENSFPKALLHVEECLDQIEKFRNLIGIFLKKEIQDERAGIQRIRIDDLFEGCLALLYHNLFFKHQVKAEKNISPALPSVKAEYADLSLALWNLIQNALEAMEKSPVKVLTLGAGMEGGRIKVTIQDTGCGISEEAKSHLFEPFFTTKKGKHRGLGLFTSRFLLEACGASLKVSSHEGESVFTVYLPASPSPDIDRS